MPLFNFRCIRSSAKALDESCKVPITLPSLPAEGKRIMKIQDTQLFLPGNNSLNYILVAAREHQTTNSVETMSAIQALLSTTQGLNIIYIIWVLMSQVNK